MYDKKACWLVKKKNKQNKNKQIKRLLCGTCEMSFKNYTNLNNCFQFVFQINHVQSIAIVPDFRP